MMPQNIIDNLLKVITNRIENDSFLKGIYFIKIRNKFKK